MFYFLIWYRDDRTDRNLYHVRADSEAEALQAFHVELPNCVIVSGPVEATVEDRELFIDFPLPGFASEAIARNKPLNMQFRCLLN
jgi:hypothetical protein